MQKIVAVTNQKGGVGKTTTAINLSAGLALEGYKTLLIDLDPQANSTLNIGIKVGSYKNAIHNVLEGNKKIENVILSTPITNLDIVPSHIHLDKTELAIINEPFRESILSDALKDLQYDFFIIDCRPTLGTLTTNALYACNFILVPCEIGQNALDGFSDLMEIIFKVKRSKEIGDIPIQILLTKFEARNKRSNDFVLEGLKFYEKNIFKIRIRKNEALNQAHMVRQPIFTFQPASSGANDYKQLTKEFLNTCQTK